jgi:hypothetical protein
LTAADARQALTRGAKPLATGGFGAVALQTRILHVGIARRQRGESA